jgi:hypothetical protein
MNFNYTYSPSLIPWYLNDYYKSEFKMNYEGIGREELEDFHSYTVTYRNEVIHRINLFINKDYIELCLIAMSLNSCKPISKYVVNDKEHFYDVADLVLTSIVSLYQENGLPIIK